MSLEYDLYIKNTFTLAKTLVIKSEVSANFINAGLIKAYGYGAVDLNDPTTWKYYLNISGEYHPLDKPIYITSIDTQETILFSKENLVINGGTKNNYQFGTSYYDALVAAYPDQELLILGILYPIDINYAISANDGQILTYPSYLVEDQEYTLIDDLQKWIYNYTFRWNVYAFNYSDNLYAVSQLATMYLALPAKILNLRLARCKTIEANSYHINTYLASNNNLNVYINYLTLEQKMFLYRNIKYIQRHGGSVSTFNTLVKKLLTDINMPMYELNMRKLPASNVTFTSEGLFKSDSINNISAFGIKDLYTLDEVVQKELPLTYDNEFYYDKHKDIISDKLTYSLNNYYKTKALISKVVKFDNPTGFTMEEVLVNNFAYVSYFNILKSPVTLALTTNNVISLKPVDALYLLIYLTLSLNGNKIKMFPNIYITKALRFTPPDISEIEPIVDLPYFTVKDIYDDLISTLPNTKAINSIVDFKNYSSEVYITMKNQYLYIANTSNPNRRGYVQLMSERFFADYKVTTTDVDTDVDTWLIKNSIDLTGYTLNDYENLYATLVQTITGYDINDKDSLVKTQEAVMSALIQLSSYSIQPLYSVNTDIVDAGSIAIRSGDPVTEVLGSKSYIPPDILGLELYLNEPRTSADATSYVDASSSVVYSYIEDISIDTTDVYSLINLVPVSQRQYL